MPHNLKARIDAISDQELESLLLAAEHLSSKQIAHRLGVAPQTVDNRISRAVRKLDVNDRPSAIRLLKEAAQTPWGQSNHRISSLFAPAVAAAEMPLSRLPWPWPTRWRPTNDLSFGMKIALVLLIATGMMLVAAVYVVSVIALDRLT